MHPYPLTHARRAPLRLVVGGLLLALTTLVTSSTGVSNAQLRGGGPPLVYVVVIDGLDGDRVDDGKAPFISSLLAGRGANATYFEESRSVMVAETNPNHVAMMTGAYGGRSGNPGNIFAIYAPLEGEEDNEADSCKRTGPINRTSLPTVTSGEDASCPSAQMVFEAIKRQGNPDRLVTAALFGKRKLGLIFAGKNVNPRRRDVDYLWAPCGPEPTQEQREYCADVPVDPVPTVMDRTLHDRIVMDQVIRTIRHGVPARGGMRRPDLTFVNLPQVDSAGHVFGSLLSLPGPGIDEQPFGELRYDQAIDLADQQVERLVSALRDEGIWERSVLILLSDHSMEGPQIPIVLNDLLTLSGIDQDDFLVVQNGSVDMVYLADRTSPERFKLLRRMRAIALSHPGIGEAMYREPNPLDDGKEHTLDGVHPAWRAAGGRTGDLFVSAKPGFRFSDPRITSNPFLGNHGAPQTRDNFFAVIGGGPLVRQRTIEGEVAGGFDDTLLNPHQAENVDVAPTVMRLFGLEEPRDSRGRFLRQAFDRDLLPPRR